MSIGVSEASGGTVGVPGFGSTLRDAYTPSSIATTQALTGLVRQHNARWGGQPSRRATVRTARQVYRRGWKQARGNPVEAMHRVRQHLSTLGRGMPPQGYHGDVDLLPSGHVLHDRAARGVKALVIEAVKAGRFDPMRHPRDKNGRFLTLGSEVSSVGANGKQVTGTVVGHDRTGVQVRDAKGAVHTVDAARTTVTAHPVLADHADAGEHAAAVAGNVHDTSVPGGLARAVGDVKDHGHAVILGQDAHSQRHADEAVASAQRAGMLGARQQHVTVGGQRGIRVFDESRQRPVPGDPNATPPAPKTPGMLPKSSPATRPDGQAWGSGYEPADPRSDPDYDRYTSDVNNRIDYAMDHVGDTETLHDKIDGVEGSYQPERAAQHRQIISDMLAQSAGVPRTHSAIILAGPPGAGKSTTIKKNGGDFGVESDAEGKPTNYVVLGGDEMKEEMARRGMVPDDYSKLGLTPGEQVGLIHEESMHLTAMYQRALLANGTNVILDGTFSGKRSKQERRVKSLKGNGYRVRGVLVDSTVDRSLTNAGGRHRQDGDMKSAPLTGRYVPIPVIESNRPSGAHSPLLGRPHRSAASENFEHVAPMFDAGHFIYEASPEGPRLSHSEVPNSEGFGGSLGEPDRKSSPVTTSPRRSFLADLEEKAKVLTGPTITETRGSALAWPGPPDAPQDMQRLNGGQGASTLSIDDDGLVWALVNVTGTTDEVDDITEPGCFEETLRIRVPKGVWSHDTKVWVSRTEQIAELRPGDPMLPKTTRYGDPWPRQAGGLLVATRFNLDTLAGHDAYSNVRFFDEGPLGPQTEWSIGYNVPRGGSFRDNAGRRHITRCNVFEYGPTLFGAHPLVGSFATQARQTKSLRLN